MMHHNFELSTCADGSPVPEYLLGSFVIFQGVRTSIHKEVYSFVCVCVCCFFWRRGPSLGYIHVSARSTRPTRPEVKSAPKSALRHCTKISCAASDGDFCSIHPGAKTLFSLHICAGVVTGQCNKYQDLMRWQRRLWRVCKFTQARLSLVIVPKYHVLARMAIYCYFVIAAKALASLHICIGLP